MTDFLSLCKDRYAVRKFTDKMVSEEDIVYLKEAIRLAPSAANRQPWKFIFVVSQEAKEKLCQCYHREWFKTAPMYVIAMKNEHACWVREEDGKQHADIDVAIATEHLCLAAADRGLGTCWVCNYDIELVKKYFPFKDFEAVALIPVGYIDTSVKQPEKVRKSAEEIFQEI